MDRLGVFKALGDDTRYAIYQELARAPGALGTSELSRRLGLHPNTVRPQLERLREAGLVEMRADGQGTVGRPEHRWSVAAAGPLAGVEPSGFRLLAHMLADTAARAGVAEEDLRAVGAGRGGESPVAGDARTCLSSFVEQMSSLGFDPSVEGPGPEVNPSTGMSAGAEVSVAFARCPFRELAAAFPDLVCHLHRGLVEGMVDGGPVQVRSFATLLDPDPCRVALALQ